MAGLEGSINTPIGTVPKKTALMLGGAAVLIGGIIWYRQKNLAASATPAVTDGEIDPATGYPYGSPEDAAALAGQNQYQSPPATGGGGSGVPTSNVGYTSNGQWTQATIEIMTSNGSVSDPSALSAALGKYVTGAYVAPDDANTNNLIQQAIAANGYPPIAGPTGYPPSINRTPPSSGAPGSHKPGPITNLRATSVGTTSVKLAWNIAVADKGYDVKWTGSSGNLRQYKTVDPNFTATALTKNHTYTFYVRARPITGSEYGDWASVTVKTKAK